MINHLKFTILLLYQVVSNKAVPVTDSHSYQWENSHSYNSPVKRSYSESYSSVEPAVMNEVFTSTSTGQGPKLTSHVFMPSPASYTSSDYERLKSLMFYHPSVSEDSSHAYKGSSMYDHDSEDIRTASGNIYDAWPYYHQPPFEYTHSDVDVEIAKAKDKRFANEGTYRPIRDVIPVHEVIDEGPSVPYRYADYPLSEEQPFFSYVIQNYGTTRSPDDEDSFSFNSFDLPQGYESDKHYHDHDSSYYTPKDHYYDNAHKHHIDATTNNQVRDKGYDRKKEFDKSEKGSNENANEKAAYEKAEKNYNGFKKFSENFANKFGSEENNKDSNYVMKNIKDKAEKKKGFHRVYHKDEYQMDKEFYDNTANLVKAEENGNSKFKNGANVGSLESNAVAAVSDKADASHKAGSADRNKFANSHSGYDGSSGRDKHYNRYNNINTHEELDHSAYK